MRNVRQIAVLIAFVLAISARVSTAAPDFYTNLLRRGIGEFNAGRYASASTLLRTAAFGLLDAIDQFETAQTYIAVASQRLGREDDARQATRRILQAERIQRRFSALPLPTELRTEFDSVASRYLTGAEHAALNDTKAAVPPRQPETTVNRRTIETPRQAPEPVTQAPAVTSAPPKTAPAPSAPVEATAPKTQAAAKATEVTRPTAEVKPQRPAAKQPTPPAPSTPVPSVVPSTPAPERAPQPKTTEPTPQLPVAPVEEPKRETVPPPVKAPETTPEPVTKKAEVTPPPAKPETKVEVDTVPAAPEKPPVVAAPPPAEQIQKPAVATTPAPSAPEPIVEAKPAPAEKREPQSTPPPAAKPAPAAAPSADAVREAQREFERKVAEVEREERKTATRPAPSPDVTKALQEAVATLDKGDVYGSRAQLRAIFETPNLKRADVLRIAEEAYRAQDFRLSADAFDRAGALGKGEEALGYYLAVALYETGRYEAAKAAMNAALPYIEVTEAVARYRAKIEGAADSARDKHSLP